MTLCIQLTVRTLIRQCSESWGRQLSQLPALQSGREDHGERRSLRANRFKGAAHPRVRPDCTATLSTKRLKGKSERHESKSARKKETETNNNTVPFNDLKTAFSKQPRHLLFRCFDAADQRAPSETPNFGDGFANRKPQGTSRKSLLPAAIP